MSESAYTNTADGRRLCLGVYGDSACQEKRKENLGIGENVQLPPKGNQCHEVSEASLLRKINCMFWDLAAASATPSEYLRTKIKNMFPALEWALT
jgi:hypothetical protein